VRTGNGAGLRLSIRRFTRRTNACSKTIESQAAMVDLYFMSYSFARVHQTSDDTSDRGCHANHVWAIEEIVALVW